MKNFKTKGFLKILGILLSLAIILFLLCYYAISKQQQRTVIEMANKIQSSAEYYAMMQIMDNNVKEVVINFPDNTLDIKGTLPKNGYVRITTDTRIEMLYYYNGYCVSKSLNENTSKFTKTSENECLKK